MFPIIFVVLAIVFFILHAFGVASKINLQSIGLACLAISMLVGLTGFPT